ncbi:putative cytochrome b5 family protein [Lyophyllum shimeji]|uniref:Cytochrome b5 family protein n=1 Tax=Lyophyllum shimeji TaxID=47721 RepID=A0A9P3UUQ1_LYOSH|nr:putative cytochrome b5 family protein [Lyophyllum shimeji]
MLELQTLVISSLALAIPAAYLVYRHCSSPARAPPQPAVEPAQKPLKSIMQAPREDLAPPKDDPYTTEELKQYDGSNPSLPIYVAIKGTIFDVTHKRDVYGPGKSYSVFAGKDGSKGLGMSSLDPAHAVADYSGLDEKDRKVLDDWHAFFSKRYNIVGRVVDSPVQSPEAPTSSL